MGASRKKGGHPIVPVHKSIDGVKHAQPRQQAGPGKPQQQQHQVKQKQQQPPPQQQAKQQQQHGKQPSKQQQPPPKQPKQQPKKQQGHLPAVKQQPPQPKQQPKNQQGQQPPLQQAKQGCAQPKQQQQQQPKHARAAGAAAPATAGAKRKAPDATAAPRPAKQAKRQGKAQPQPQAAAAAGAALPGAAVAATVTAKPWQPGSAAAVGSNWQALRQQLAEQQAAAPKRRRRPREGQQQQADAAGGGSNRGSASASAKPGKAISSIGHVRGLTPFLAMDCEMVGVGPGGERDSLARVSLVNASGNVVYDSYVSQVEAVADYRTWVSGVTPQHLAGAPSLAQVQADVAALLEGRTLVGHGLKKDLQVLLLSHPRKAIRDTARYPPFMFSRGGKRRPRALRHLASQELGLAIQEGSHSSVDDARAALYLYQKHAAAWEAALRSPGGLKALPTGNAAPRKRKRVESYAARDVGDDPMADL